MVTLTLPPLKSDTVPFDVTILRSTTFSPVSALTTSAISLTSPSSPALDFSRKMKNSRKNSVSIQPAVCDQLNASGLQAFPNQYVPFFIV